MPGDETRQLARIAQVTDDLDKLLDDLFASVAELRHILTPPEPPAVPPERRPGT